METNDWFMKQLQIIPQKLPTIVQHSREPMLDVSDDFGETQAVPLRDYLLELMLNLELNKAENILFEQFDKLSDKEITEITDWFYERIEALSERELIQANFLVADIKKGRLDVAKLLNKEG